MNDEQDRTGQDRTGQECMSKMEAVGILLQLACKRTTTRDEVVAIQVACRSTLKRFFDHERNWKRKHEAEDSPAKVDRLRAFVRELCECLEEENAEAYKLLIEKARRAAQ